ncbi:E3 ubiquitin-protein ligase MARCH9 [Takifugu flavidus]|uniref:E3 ubiquitin-protein ligase MARCH9 n=1 Tax=Takifugu flavidus TaxID=433684 RepID=A0A5C6MPH9_9TELE|nr:E3 ubiquitin-protein ligase MARCH9 [Takifugu flavidus]
MFKYRIRMFFNELKVLVFMRSDSRQSGSDSDRRSSAMRGLGMGGCGWPPFVDCRPRDDEEEYYGSEPRPRSLAFEDKEPRLQVGLDAVSLASTSSSMRTPQCRICFQGPEQGQSERQDHGATFLRWSPAHTHASTEDHPGKQSPESPPPNLRVAVAVLRCELIV